MWHIYNITVIVESRTILTSFLFVVCLFSNRSQKMSKCGIDEHWKSRIKCCRRHTFDRCFVINYRKDRHKAKRYQQKRKSNLPCSDWPVNCYCFMKKIMMFFIGGSSHFNMVENITVIILLNFLCKIYLYTRKKGDIL